MRNRFLDKPWKKGDKFLVTGSSRTHLFVKKQWDRSGTGYIVPREDFIRADRKGSMRHLKERPNYQQKFAPEIAGQTIVLDGTGYIYQAPVMIGSITYGFAGVLLVYRSCSRFFSRSSSASAGPRSMACAACWAGVAGCGCVG